GREQCHRCLWDRRGALPIAHGTAALCWWSNLRDDQVIAGYRAAATAPVKSENRSRSQHNLPQVSRERSKAPLLFRSRAGRRSRTLAQARTDSGATHRSFCARREMDPAQSNKYTPRGVSGWSGGGRWLDRLEKRTD